MAGKRYRSIGLKVCSATMLRREKIGSAIAIGLVVVGIGSARYFAAGGRISLVGNPPVQAVPLLSAEDQTMRSKLAPVVSCINRVLVHFQGVLPQFLSTVQGLSHPVGRGTRPYPTYEGNLFNVTLWDKNGSESTMCADGLEKAAKMPPQMKELDAMAVSAAQTLRRIIKPGQQWDIYIDQKTYLDDGFSTGRDLSATLSPLLTDLASKSARIEELSDIEDNKVRLHQLAAIERYEGHTPRWHVERTMIEARGLVEEIGVRARAGSLDSAAMDAAIRPLQSAYDEAAANSATHPDTSGVWREIDSTVSAELRDAKELRRTLANPPPEDASDHASRLQTLVRNVGAEFDILVDSYNSAAKRGA